MPNIASAKKRVRQNEVRRQRNRARRTRLRSVLRSLDEAIEAGDLDRVRSCWADAQSMLDTTARLGVIHRNNAARKKARLAKRVAAAGV